MLIKHVDGREETLHAGDVIYFPPDHTCTVPEDLKLIGFSYYERIWGSDRDISKKMAEIKTDSTWPSAQTRM